MEPVQAGAGADGERAAKRQKTSHQQSDPATDATRVYDRFEAVLTDEETRGVELVPCWAVRVRERKAIGALFQALSRLYPMKHYDYLKRVKKLDEHSDARGSVNLVLACEDTTFECPESVRELCAQSSPTNSIEVVHVPKYAPMNEQQRREWMRHWPVNTPSTTPPIDIYPTEVVCSFVSHLLLARTLAEEAFVEGHRACAGVMVDSKGTVVATGKDRSNANVLDHAAMMAIATVAADYRRTYGESTPNDGPYLCTNYRYFTFREPCPMCAMALLHSRIALVAYVEAATHGGLGSMFKIHCTRPLNHHFHVYRVKLD